MMPQQRLNTGKQHLTRLGQPDTARGAIQQAHIQPVLQCPNRLAQGRRRQAQMIGCFAETATLCHRDECPQLRKLRSVHCVAQLNNLF